LAVYGKTSVTANIFYISVGSASLKTN